jgi:hypothetical protein
MAIFRPQRPHSIERSGANAGSVLCGVAPSNRGLRLSISEQQVGDDSGPIRGSFVLLDAGDNRHSASLRFLVGTATNAAEVLAAIRGQSAGCVSVVNRNILAVEGT